MGGTTAEKFIGQMIKSLIGVMFKVVWRHGMGVHLG